MKLTFAFFAPPLALLALGACIPIEYSPLARATNGANVTIGTDGSDTTVNGVALADTTVAGGLTTPGYANFTNAGTDRYLFIGKSASGDMSSALVATSGAAVPMNFAAYSRNSAGELPTTGSANMTGNYVGMIGPTAGTELDNALIAYATGDANMTANFATNAVTGTITNRMISGAATADVALNSTGISGDATYAGTATGGAPATFTTTAGSYQGMLGANGTETAGGVKLLYNDGVSTYAELGAFVAD